MEGKPQARLQEVSAVAQEATPQQGKSAQQIKCWRRSTTEPQWDGTCRVRLHCLHGHPAGRVLAKKVSSGPIVLIEVTCFI